MFYSRKQNELQSEANFYDFVSGFQGKINSDEDGEMVMESLDIGNGGKLSCQKSSETESLNEVNVTLSDLMAVRANGRVWCSYLHLTGSVSFP